MNELVHVVRDIFKVKNDKKAVNEQEVKRVMDAIDTNKDGKVSKEEFLELLKRCSHN
jgi:Ca2+-binding EF-hand superfamily protein